MNPKAFAGIIAYILLFIYAASIFFIVMSVLKCSDATKCPPIQLSTGLIYSVTLIGGLVSALVVSKLASTSPGGSLTMTSTETIVEGPEKFVAALYLIIWLIAGLASFFVGEVLYPGVSSTLSDIGKTWIGLAISAAYAYFGIKPAENR
jgi:hypothetical protein